ncbi:hypothetical protein Ciccas_013536 [Cichlidogyrus casuarinus]|uniref:FAM13A-like domain-containing protein n=1 Tax=Cichlidogyrus casuarinus TaxID=1844966 RepID=A0ABD2PLU0_9PLAT
MLHDQVEGGSGISTGLSSSFSALQNGSQETLALFNTLESQRSLLLGGNESIYPKFHGSTLSDRPDVTSSNTGYASDNCEGMAESDLDLSTKFRAMSLAELRFELTKVSTWKKDLQRKLKNFEHSVEATKGCKITATERAQKKSDYDKYRNLKKCLKELESAVETREQMLTTN